MTQTSMKVIVVIVLILLGGSVYFTFGTKDSATKVIEQEVHVDTGEHEEVTENHTSSTQVPGETETTEEQTGTEKIFTVKGNNFAFFPSTLTVNKGDKVKIVFENTGGFHDLKIDEFKVATKKIQGDTSDTVEFIADKAGSFEYYCSVGSHRAMGMKGTLIVR